MSSRRTLVPFDPFYFEGQKRAGKTFGRREAFEHAYRSHLWTGSESVSGEGSGAAQTSRLQQELPALLRRLGVQTLLDLPCGDYTWMKDVDLPVARYIGADIVPALVEANRTRFGDDRHTFVALDLVSDPLPPADLILCRDVLVHLSFADIHSAIANIRRAGIPFLLTTTFPEHAVNEDIVTGDWRLLNLQREPFGFPPPRVLINEGCTEGNGAYGDKSLALWALDELP